MLRGVHSGLPEYWGDVGHYTIGAKACQLIDDPDLSKLMMANLDRIAYGDDNIRNEVLQDGEPATLSPLADVPTRCGSGPAIRLRGATVEIPNHFADMDKPNSRGDTLLELTAGADGRTDPTKVTIEDLPGLLQRYLL